MLRKIGNLSKLYYLRWSLQISESEITRQLQAVNKRAIVALNRSPK